MSAPHRLSIDFSPSDEIRDRIADLWARGENSADIALVVGIREATVCRVLRTQQDARHALRQREAQHA
nr:hypothetical protein NG677_04405 [Methylobacterium sp. OTU13CASTA1]